jgi:hypothetical protein
MRGSIGFAMLVCACMQPPPAVDPAELAEREPAPLASVPPPAPAPVPVPVPSTGAKQTVPLPAAKCPVGTGRRQFCEGRKVCSRDAKGCESCTCNTEHDASRARFEHMNPWDMRQR